LREKTIVIFTSDNGGLIPITSNKPLRSGKGYPYEGGIREPVIIRWPGKIPAGREVDEPISSIDYFPTLSARQPESSCPVTGLLMELA